MNKELQRIRIAEACGWREIQNGDAWDTPIGIPVTMLKKDNWRNMEPFYELPQYLHDLNAMHEAEKVLTKPQQNKFILELDAIDGGDGDYFDIAHASAAQRAEAFLRTLNLWEK
jgi:hypothetical protein